MSPLMIFVYLFTLTSPAYTSPEECDLTEHINFGINLVTCSLAVGSVLYAGRKTISKICQTVKSYCPCSRRHQTPLERFASTIENQKLRQALLTGKKTRTIYGLEITLKETSLFKDTRGDDCTYKVVAYYHPAIPLRRAHSRPATVINRKLYQIALNSVFDLLEDPMLIPTVELTSTLQLRLTYDVSEELKLKVIVKSCIQEEVFDEENPQDIQIAGAISRARVRHVAVDLLAPRTELNLDTYEID